MLPGGYSRGVQTTLSDTSVMHCTPPQVNAPLDTWLRWWLEKWGSRSGGMEEMGSAVTMTDREKHLAPLWSHGHGAIPTFTLPVKVGTWKRR